MKKTAQRNARSITPLPSHERHFYASNRAFGRFGIRVFDPVIMDKPHWHGHLEINFAHDFEMAYDVNGTTVTVEANRAVAFWAGIPHRLTDIRPMTASPGKLCNIYLPLDSFLMMRHVAPLQVALLGGGMISLPEALCRSEDVLRWYADYRSGDFERSEVVKMELNALFRRAAIEGLAYVMQPRHEIGGNRELSSLHIRHVISMIRHVLENVEKPMRNIDITSVTGLHENYALALFSRVMRVPLKQFVVRMRMLRARALLVESTMPISLVAEASGFSSLSQFYAQFQKSYGITPAAVRREYLQMSLR
jgi:AraC-like DNA-binding protein